MAFIIACLLWLGVLVGGTYTQTYIDQLAAAHQPQIQQIASDPILKQRVETEVDPGIVTIYNPDDQGGN